MREPTAPDPTDAPIEGRESYGPAGVVLGITSYLIGFGVCLHLGAVFGKVWNDWRSAAATADAQQAETDKANLTVG
jgi:hypothetical protein